MAISFIGLETSERKSIDDEAEEVRLAGGPRFSLQVAQMLTGGFVGDAKMFCSCAQIASLSQMGGDAGFLGGKAE